MSTTQARNYLRARGEYHTQWKSNKASRELPPRTRRILSPSHFAIVGLGTTSAHAENTAWWRGLRGVDRNYLRARGEYHPGAVYPYTKAELPPRTRRIHIRIRMVRLLTGTTSAHAENTFTNISVPKTFGNYLRARGEYPMNLGPASALPELPPRTRRILYVFYVTHHFPWELPPRTRRILCRFYDFCTSIGTTSAHAENTNKISSRAFIQRNYLRARGEYLEGKTITESLAELPPRTRRIPLDWHLRWILTGTTSAHAENTVCKFFCVIYAWNYLRARGEYPK